MTPTANPQLQRLLSAEEVCDLLGMSVHTLYYWRQSHAGPPAIRCGRWLRYDPADLQDWLQDHKADKAAATGGSGTKATQATTPSKAVRKVVAKASSAKTTKPLSRG